MARMEDRKRTYALFTIATLVGAFGGLTQTSMNSMLGGVEMSFGLDESISQWLTTIYMLTVGVTVPLVTHLARRFPMRTLILISIGFMAAGSLMAALAPAFAILFIARIIQAISTGITLPLVMTIAMTRFPSNKTATAMGIAGIAFGFAPNIGPLFGGLLVDAYGWRSFFLILFACMAVLAICSLVFIGRRDREAQDSVLDVLSAILSTLGFGGLLTSFSSMSYKEFNDPLVWIGLIVGVFCLVWFFIRQTRIEHPLIHLVIFKSKTFRVCFFAQIMLYASFMGIALIIPLFVINISQLTPVDAGLVFLPTTILALACNPLSGIVSDKIGPRPVIIFAAAMLAIGSILMTFINETTPLWYITALQVIRGIGVSSIIGPSNSWGLHKLQKQYMIDGSTFLNTTRQACASLGTAIMMIFISVVQGCLGYNLALGISALFATGVLVICFIFVHELDS